MCVVPSGFLRQSGGCRIVSPPAPPAFHELVAMLACTQVPQERVQSRNYTVNEWLGAKLDDEINAGVEKFDGDRPVADLHIRLQRDRGFLPIRFLHHAAMRETAAQARIKAADD